MANMVNKILKQIREDIGEERPREIALMYNAGINGIQVIFDGEIYSKYPATRAQYIAVKNELKTTVLLKGEEIK